MKRSSATESPKKTAAPRVRSPSDMSTFEVDSHPHIEISILFTNVAMMLRQKEALRPLQGATTVRPDQLLEEAA